MDEGYVKLYRSLKNWRWYTDGPTLRIYIHLVLSANWKEGAFKYSVIKRGQVVMSISKLSNDLKISQSTVARSLKKLKRTGEITSRRISNYSVITITDYDVYQSDAPAKKQAKSAKQTSAQVKEEPAPVPTLKAPEEVQAVYPEEDEDGDGWYMP